MNLLARLKSRFWRREQRATASEVVPFEAAAASGLVELQFRLNQWSHLWPEGKESSTDSAAQQLVAERLTRWMERCFGQHVSDSFRGTGERISLASSTPICTAFLGRRATRELSRHVLQDI
jgi:hypothetical protein